MFLLGVPLLIIPFAFYNIVVFLLPGLEWAEPLARITLPSQAIWTLTLGDFVVAIAIIILFVEVAKSISAERRNVVDYLLSLLLFAGMLAEFLLIKQAATTTFFLLLVACFVDVIGGFAFLRKAVGQKVAFEGIDRAQTP